MSSGTADSNTRSGDITKFTIGGSSDFSPVAQVISIQLDQNNPFQHIVVELLGSLEKLDYVFVVL